MQSQTLHIGSQAIAFYTSAGTGPSALLIHGNSSSGLSFQHQLESPLGEKFRLVALDLPGHGQSEPAIDPQSTYTTPPIGFPPAMAEAFLPNPAMGAAFKAELTKEEMDAFVAAFFKPDVTDIPDSFKTDVRRTDGRARQVMGSSIGPGGYKDELEVVANLSVPLAILHGEQEQLVNLSYISGLTMPTLWRGAVQIIPQAGHAPHWEQPQRFNTLLEAFIEETAR